MQNANKSLSTIKELHINFCVVTGINYAAKSLLMYDSLIKYARNFTLFYLCFDKEMYMLLDKLKYANIVIISMSEFEDDELLLAKRNRTTQEYYFTITPSILRYIIMKYKVDHCIYLDADMEFYNDPRLLLEEWESNSIFLTEHNYSLSSIESHKSGRFCVQFMPIKNDSIGLDALQWWRERCLEWCYLRSENGKWADQGYLNDWPERFDKVHIISHQGAGIAPWNHDLYITGNEDSEYIIEKKTKNKIQIIFYHYQGFVLLNKYAVVYSSYSIQKDFRNKYYKAYIKNIVNKITELNNITHISYNKVSIKSLMTAFRKYYRNKEGWFFGNIFIFSKL